MFVAGEGGRAPVELGGEAPEHGAEWLVLGVKQFGGEYLLSYKMSYRENVFASFRSPPALTMFHK